MGLLQKIRDLWVNRNKVSDDDALPPSRDPHEISTDDAGAGNPYSGLEAPPGYVRDE